MLPSPSSSPMMNVWEICKNIFIFVSFQKNCTKTCSVILNSCSFFCQIDILPPFFLLFRVKCSFVVSSLLLDVNISLDILIHHTWRDFWLRWCCSTCVHVLLYTYIYTYVYSSSLLFYLCCRVFHFLENKINWIWNGNYFQS